MNEYQTGMEKYEGKTIGSETERQKQFEADVKFAANQLANGEDFSIPYISAVENRPIGYDISDVDIDVLHNVCAACGSSRAEDPDVLDRLVKADVNVRKKI